MPNGQPLPPNASRKVPSVFPNEFNAFMTFVLYLQMKLCKPGKKFPEISKRAMNNLIIGQIIRKYLFDKINFPNINLTDTYDKFAIWKKLRDCRFMHNSQGGSLCTVSFADFVNKTSRTPLDFRFSYKNVISGNATDNILSRNFKLTLSLRICI